MNYPDNFIDYEYICDRESDALREYIEYRMEKLDTEVKKALLNHGISVNMLETFIKIFSYSYFEGCKEAIDLAHKLDLTDLHMLLYNGEKYAKETLEEEFYENM